MLEKGYQISRKVGTNRVCIIYDRKDHNKTKYDFKALTKAREVAGEIEDFYPM